ncbi:MAG: chromosomal replication initiator DnaA [Rhodobacteraceae bacterium]|nr:chromosomal replication initiator DnaA [Paracoccaceae bacterium]
MAEQLTFDLPVRPALGREDFFVSPANMFALAALDAGDWPGGKLLLIGPEGAGKSHLARVWASESGARILPAALLPEMPVGERAIVVEDAEGIAGNREAETRLFHIHNLVLAEGGRLLLTARLHPSRWGLVLPDLASRMEATAVAEIAPPDDALLAAVLAKHFSDRQLSVQTNLLAWLVRRMDRSFAAARGLVAAVDARALARGTAVTRALAQEVLDSMGVPGNDADG